MNIRLLGYFFVVLALVAIVYLMVGRLYPAPPNSRPEIIKKLFHQMARWTTAATQDENPVIRVLHANYGMGYLMAIQSIASEEEMKEVLGLRNIKDLVEEVQRVQNEATLNLVKQCPTAAPQNMLAKYGSTAIDPKQQIRNDFSKSLFEQGQI